MTSFFSIGAFAQCKVTEAGMHLTYQDANTDLDDFGRILIDADDPACAQNALNALYDKVNDGLNNHPNHMPHPVYQEWLDGYKVSLAFAAAMRIGANGWASKDLDVQLQALEARFVPESRKPGPPEAACGNESLGTCMDSDSGAAAAYAWMAAYDRRRGRDAQATANGNTAISFMHSSLSDVCIYDPASTDHSTLCNGLAANLVSPGTAVTMSVNHSQENIAYGFGLMTGLASASVGLGAAGMSYTPTGNDAVIANALFAEAQRHVDANGDFKKDCATPVKSNGIWTITYDADCADPTFHYTPNMWALKHFYETTGFTVPQIGTYRSDFPGGSFRMLSTDNNTGGFLFSFGRYVFYQTIAYSWLNSSPDFMPVDANDPIGFLDGISATGVASGWSCDQDQPTGRGVVDLYDTAGHSTQGFANSSSEPAVNQLCGGGTAHRFSIQLPPNMADSNITAYGLDYTWYGFTQLPCLQTPQCSFSSCTTAAITTQPVSSPTTITSGSSANLTITVSGTSPTIQWYTSAGVNVGSGPSITVSPTSTTVYHATVVNTCTPIFTSANVAVSVGASCAPATITSQPVSTPGTIAPGGAANLTIGVSGTSPTVQWYTAAGTYVDTATSISVSPAVTTTYYASVFNACTPAFSSATATVTVCAPAAITAQPTATPAAIKSGTSATLAIGVFGTSPNIQWYTSAGVNVGSGSSITVNPTVDTTYYATVGSSCSSTLTSANVAVTIDHRPTASFTVSCTGTTCSADASASSDDHGITAFSWEVNGVSTGVTTATWTATLPTGKNSIKLFVSDALNQSNNLEKKVTVTP